MTAKSTPKPKLFDLPVALAQLDELESYFNQPTLDLEEGMQKHKQAVALAKEIESYLASVESQLEVVEVDPT